VNAELTRRSFIFRTGAAAASASALLGAVRVSAVRAAVDGLRGDSTVVVRWSAAALEAIRETHPGPPMVARALAMVHTAIFDAWAAYDADAVGTRLGGSLRRPEEERTDANKREALSYAAYRTLVDLYPGATQVSQFDSLMRELGYDPANASRDKSTPSGIGNRVAAALLEFRHGDGSNQLGGYADTSGYVPVNDSTHINDPNRWQPLRPAGATADQRYIAPHWGKVTPFALTPGSHRRDRQGVGGALPGNGQDRRRGLASLPGGQRRDAALPRVPLGPQHVQRRGRRGPQALHGLGRVRGLRHPTRRDLARRAGRGAQEGRDPVLKTFSDAADEAGISRRYGGIHFAQGDLDGREMGRKVGAQAWDRAQEFVNGTA